MFREDFEHGLRQIVIDEGADRLGLLRKKRGMAVESNFEKFRLMSSATKGGAEKTTVIRLCAENGDAQCKSSFAIKMKDVRGEGERPALAYSLASSSGTILRILPDGVSPSMRIGSSVRSVLTLPAASRTSTLI